MWRFLLIAGVIVVVAPQELLAKGGYVRPPEPTPVRAGLPTASVPKPPLGMAIGGCGPKRLPDPQTHQCRGPADFGN